MLLLPVEPLTKFFSELLTNATVTKVGLGLKPDFKTLAARLPDLPHRSTFKSVVDL